MSTRAINRRHFLGGVAATAAVNLIRPEAVFGAAANEKITAGVIGLGGRGRMITRMLLEHGGYALTAVADYFPEVVDRAGEEFGVPKERRFSGLQGYAGLIGSGVETVFLETPPYCFPDHAAAAVDAGCHVFMAKPVACDVPGCLRIRESAQKATGNQRVFLVDFQKRADPLVIEGVQRVRNGEIGKIVFISSIYTDESFPDPPLTENIESRLQHLIWVNDTALGGSSLVNAGIHAVDAALWLAGATPVSAVGASRVARNDPHGDSHDIYSITYEFADGLIINHRGEHLRNRFDFHCDCVAHCQDGYLETAYNGKVFMSGIRTGWKGGDVQSLYSRGAITNIATFHDSVRNGVYDNPTVTPSVDATLATILGRDAALRRTRVTWDGMLEEQQRIEPDLSGLRA